MSERTLKITIDAGKVLCGECRFLDTELPQYTDEPPWYYCDLAEVLVPSRSIVACELAVNARGEPKRSLPCLQAGKRRSGSGGE